MTEVDEIRLKLEGNEREQVVHLIAELNRLQALERRELVRLKLMGLMYPVLALAMVTIFGASFLANRHLADAFTAAVWASFFVFDLWTRRTLR